MKANELFTTSDGSHSLLSSTFEVPYHSRHGAIGETQHVFIDAGFKSKLNLDQISVLDIGFGTGLNALMTVLASEALAKNVYYEAIEAFPIDLATAESINYPEQLQTSNTSYLDMHRLAWAEDHQLSNSFTFHKQLTSFQEFETTHSFDIIYYDAFAPSAQPELWEVDILQKMFNLLNDDGVLVTYCAQGQFKRNLKAVGFTIEPLPGPEGKREMTRARKVEAKEK